jgi:hypothetical protein
MSALNIARMDAGCPVWGSPSGRLTINLLQEREARLMIGEDGLMAE